jgi:CRISPR-associated exonuclease Cas4
MVQYSEARGKVPESESPLSALRVGGTEVHYCVLCERKLWWFAHGMEQEHTSDLVAQGRHVQEQSYDRRRKEIAIDGAVRIDGLETEGQGVEAVVTVHEVKKSRGGRQAHRMQLLYYLYVLWQKGVGNARGVLEYPLEKRREEVALTAEAIADVEDVLRRIEAVRALPLPPEVAEPMGICGKCAYQELCWG